jgi:glycosyltransferase involved in cell wall biosynthesis
MRIMHLTTALARGGLERLICLLAACNRDDHENEMVVIIINNIYDQDLMKKLERTAAKIICLNRRPGRPWSLLYYVATLRKVLVSVKPDVLHYHNKVGFIVAFLSSAGLSMKKVYTLHNTRLFSTTLWGRFCKYVVIRGTDVLIAISRSVKEDFCQNDETAYLKTEIVPNGIDISEFKRSSPANRVPRIICVGRLTHEQKGQDILIKALAMLADSSVEFRCDFVGEGPSRRMLESLIRDSNLRARIKLLGERSDVPFLLGQADLFVLPSRFEGFGIVILEAMAAALPIIVSDVDGPREVIVNDRNGLLFRSEDDRDLAEKIKTLLEAKEYGRKLGENARCDVQQYSIQVMYEKYIGIYKSLVLKDCQGGM